MRTELSMLEDFGADLAPVPDEAPAELRHRVMREMRAPARRSWLTPLRTLSLSWRVGIPAVAAASVAVALVAGHLPDNTRGTPPGPTEAAPQPGTPQPGTTTAAGQVLVLAADHTADTPVLTARPGQFLFIDSVDVESQQDGDGATTISRPMRTRTWLSVDGTRDGLIVQDGPRGPERTRLDGCTDGKQAETIDRPDNSPEVDCTPEPAYQPGRIPTDPASMRTYVYGAATAEPEYRAVTFTADEMPTGYVRLSDDQRAFQEIAELLAANHLPSVREAALRTAGQIPGVQVRRDATDAAGRRGIAVTRTEAGTREELVFDPTTYTYLGHNVIGTPFDPIGAQVVKDPGKTKGTHMRVAIGRLPRPNAVQFQSALLSIAIVNTAGRRP